MTEQGYRQGRSARPRGPRSRRDDAGRGPGAFEPDDGPADDLPPWAGLASGAGIRPPRRAAAPREPADRPDGPAGQPEPEHDSEPGLPGRRRRKGRAAATRRRKSRRRLVAVTAAAAVAVLGGAGWFWLSRPAPARPGVVLVLQPGEYRTVPDACKVVTGATLGKFLPGKRKVIQPLAGGAASECTYTIDAGPLFRVLDVSAQACQPYLAVPGNGSATANAVASYAAARQGLAHPPRKSAAPPATLTTVRGLGDAAVRGLQVFRLRGSVTDAVTVLVRERNVVLSVKIQAQVSARRSGLPVAALLQDGALVSARELLAAVLAEPTVS